MNHYRKGFLKYIPEFIFPKYKPNILDNIIKEDTKLGKIVGINLKPIDLNDRHNLKEFIKSIKKIPLTEFTNLYMEEGDTLRKETQEYLQEELDLQIFSGEETRIRNINYLLRKIYNLLKEKIDEKEILILCDNKDLTKKVIREIAKDMRYIAAFGCDEEANEEIYDYILEETGLSVFYPNNIQRIIENYNIIINLMKDIELDFSRIKRNTILFEFSNNNNFTKNRKLFPIEDIGFSLKELNIKDEKWLDAKIKSNLYESLIGIENNNIKYLFGRNQCYTIKDYVNSYLKVKGRL